MTEIEQVRRCAEMMGIDVVEQLGGLHRPFCQLEDSLYNPLANDAQCMALVKRFRLDILWTDDGKRVGIAQGDVFVPKYRNDNNLNAAIVSAVAQMKGVG